MEEVIRERCKALPFTHKSDKECQAYISASRHASSIISEAKAME